MNSEVFRVMAPLDFLDPEPASESDRMDELRRALCRIGVVGQIDGYEVIRRDSVIDIVDARRAVLSKSEL